MINYVFISTSPTIVQSLDDYFESSRLNNNNTVFVIEFFKQEIPTDLPNNCIPTTDLLDQRELIRISAILRNLGEIGGIISLGELALYPAADLRQKLGLSGPYKAELEKFRDKVKMKSFFSKSSIKTPKIYSADELRCGKAILPLVVKPRAYFGPIGIRVILSQDELKKLVSIHTKPQPAHYDNNFPELIKDDYQFEEFIDGITYEIAALVHNGLVIHLVVLKQINNSLDFMNGKPLGLVSVYDSIQLQLWADFTAKVLNEMNAPNGAYVIQAILNRQNERVFIGASAVPPSISMSRLIKDMCGVDYRWFHIQCQINEAINDFSPIKKGLFIGSLIFPMNYIEEGMTSLKIVKRVYPLPRELLPTLKSTHYPEIGSIAEKDFSYSHNLGRFLFLNEDPIAIESEIRIAMELYNVEVA